MSRRFDSWCTDPKCCDPPGYHHGPPPACPECRGEPHSPGDDRAMVACFGCGHQWKPQPVPLVGWDLPVEVEVLDGLPSGDNPQLCPHGKPANLWCSVCDSDLVNPFPI